MDTHDAVCHADYGALGLGFRFNLKLGNLALDQLADFRRIELHVGFPFRYLIRWPACGVGRARSRRSPDHPLGSIRHPTGSDLFPQ